MKRLKRSDVIDLLKKKQAGKTQQEFAREIGISGTLLYEIYRGTREPAGKVLNWLRLERTVEFQEKA